MIVEFSSEGIGGSKDGAFYSVTKWRNRRRWQLLRHGTTVTSPAAYFRTEDEARGFASRFGLTITEHQP